MSQIVQDIGELGNDASVLESVDSYELEPLSPSKREPVTSTPESKESIPATPAVSTELPDTTDNPAASPTNSTPLATGTPKPLLWQPHGELELQ